MTQDEEKGYNFESNKFLMLFMDIKLPIASPPFTKLGKTLESACRKALFDFSMIEEKKKIAIALSGGKDSLTLLFLLHAISGKGFPEIDIHAIFIDGDFSCGAGISTDFLKGICNKMNIPLTVREVKQDGKKLSCYPCSRNRRSLIFNIAKELGIDTIAFGHHREDSIQTLLLNLLHKAEFSAMMPKIKMHEYGVTIIRPLIYLSEKEIISFAKQHDFLRITCQCPFGQTSKRQNVKNLLTQLERDFPNTRANLFKASLLYGSSKALIP